MPSAELRREALLSEALGPLDAFLEASDVVEILLNPDGNVWVERQGQALRSVEAPWSSAHTGRLIAVVAGVTGQVCTRASPSLSAVLPRSRARFQGFLPPATPAPSCVIRCHTHALLTLEDYVGGGTMEAWQADVLRETVTGRVNIILAGATQSGKTTLASTLLGLMDGERLVTLEDTAELWCPSRNRLALYTSPSRDMTALLREALRARPDRIVLGECRGAEAVDLLDAWGTGHPGGVTTLHAGTPAEALTRLESLVRKVSASQPHPLPLDVARPLIAASQPLIGCLAKVDGVRRMTTLARVHGLSGSTYDLEPLTEGRHADGMKGIAV